MARSALLDAKMLLLSSVGDCVTLGDLNENILVVGSTGSGKTTGASKHIARARLRSGAGGLVLCAKPEEAEMWFNLCKSEGRLDSFVHFAPGKHSFNFLAHELARNGRAGVSNAVELLMRAKQIGDAVGAAIGKPGEPFWDEANRAVLRHSIPVIHAATETVRLVDILRFMRSAPTSADEMRDPTWQKESFFFSMFALAMDRLSDDEGERYANYWHYDWCRLDPKTRSNIGISLSTAIDRFNHGILKDIFCNKTTLVPELCWNGAVIVMDMATLTYNEDGIIAQQLFKYLWQRVMLSRNSQSPKDRVLPVFLHVDECQYFVNSFDAEFLSTCRGSGIGTTFLTQSLPSLYAVMGGENSAKRVDQLVGNFRTKIFHANGCPETNEWAARTIGRGLKRRNSFNYTEGSSENYGANMGDGKNWGTNSSSGTSFSSSSGNSQSSSSSGFNSSSGSSSGGNTNRGRNRGYASNEGQSVGWSEQMDHMVEPATFGRLKTGGPSNRNIVSAIWYQAGRTFARTGQNFLQVEFPQ